MPEYLAPGVYVEETEGNPKTIEGVPTATTAFVGETERGPLEPSSITSYADYLRLFGNVFDPAKYLPHSVKAFFDNGGRRCYIVRVVADDTQAALDALDSSACQDVAIVHAPAASPQIVRQVVAHCERSRSRFAVIDCSSGITDVDGLDPRNDNDTSYGAFYFPWILATDPVTAVPKLIPPGGAVCGIYARCDETRGVSKSPANEVVAGALDLEHEVDAHLQEILNPRGVNVIRRFPGRGIRVWGARTLSSDPLWKYIAVRRLFTFIEASIDKGTQWVIFEPNDEKLWFHVKRAVESFLLRQWRDGALAGHKVEEAFFVSVGRDTMTPDDILAGRLIIEIAIAPLRPAEFVIFRVVQRTQTEPT